MVITSPPYWGLRDYGLGARGIGLEPTPEAYVATLAEVFREVQRVLRDDGTCWLNCGDCYQSGSRGGYNRERAGVSKNIGATASDFSNAPNRLPQEGLKDKDLVGMPWRVAFALQADGWYLRSDIIWAKPNPMPESVTDRPTTAHEHVFLLAKRASYYYDAEAIKERVTGGSHPRGGGVHPKSGKNELHIDRRKRGFNARWRVKQNASFSAAVKNLVPLRNARTVWTIGSQPYPGAHFAVFPEALVTPCVLAGSAHWQADPRRCVVLDPFCGSGTVGVVARRHGRAFLGCDLKWDYLLQVRARLRGVQQRLHFGAV